MTERVPPHDLAAERAVLGSMLQTTDALVRGMELLQAGDFYRSAHATVFTALADAYADREPTDAVAIALRLDAKGELARVGGAPGLFELIEAAPLIASTGHYARVVSERAQMRRIIEAGTRIAQLAYDLDRDPGTTAAIASKLLSDATATRTHSDLVSWGQVIDPAMSLIEAAGKNGETPGLSTGINYLDAMTGGLRGGQLIIVAGRPGVGKSVVGVEWARQAALQQGKAAAIFSLEMGRNEIYNRVIAAETGTSLGRITRGHLTDSQWATISSRSGATEGAPLFIDDSAPITLPDIIAKSRRLHARVPLSLIVVDYLQLLETGRRSESRQQEVTEISRALKLLAKELDVPIVAAAQLNRGVEHRADKRPMLADLRESGSIEQDADIVVLLYRDDYYKTLPKGQLPVLELIVEKHRNGKRGVVKVTADFAYGRLLDTAIQSDQQ